MKLQKNSFNKFLMVRKKLKKLIFSVKPLKRLGFNPNTTIKGLIVFTQAYYDLIVIYGWRGPLVFSGLLSLIVGTSCACGLVSGVRALVFISETLLYKIIICILVFF